MIDLSIIITQYNTINYVKRFYDSLLNQTYKNIEILILDDISNDGSYEYAANLAKIDSRVKLFRAKEKMLPDKGRQFLFEKAKGEYIISLDSDDIISSNYLETMITTAKKYDSDMVISTNQRIDENDNIVGKRQVACKKNCNLFSKKKKKILKCKYGGWNRMSKKEFLIKNNYDYSQAELPLFILQFKSNAKISYTKEGTYFYRMRGNSISRSKVPSRIATYNVYEPLDWFFDIDKNCRKALATYLFRMITPYIYYKKYSLNTISMNKEIKYLLKKLGLNFFTVLIHLHYLNLKDQLTTLVFIFRLNFIPLYFIKRFRN